MTRGGLIRLALATLVALGFFAVGHPVPAGAQQVKFKSGIDMVPLTVTVTDANGRHVTGLTRTDFTVLEDGVEQPLSFFGTGEVPFDVAIVIDSSASIAPDLALVQRAACGLVRGLRASDRGAVVEVKDSVRIPQPLTADHAQIESSINALRASGNTALYDGLYVMLKEFDRARGDSRDIRRQALVLLSDGLDNTSHLAFEDVIQLARRVGVSIYVIALRGRLIPLRRDEQHESILRAEYALRTVARESGGQSFFPRTARELPAIYNAIAMELANQYELAYVPAAGGSNGAFRRLAVRLATDGLARTRTGYYAPGAAPVVDHDPMKSEQGSERTPAGASAVADRNRHAECCDSLIVFSVDSLEMSSRPHFVGQDVRGDNACHTDEDVRSSGQWPAR